MQKFDLVWYDYLHSQIALQSARGIRLQRAGSLEAWMRALCLHHGSSRSGRTDFARHALESRQFAPLIISETPARALIPVQNGADSSLIYASWERIAHLEQTEKNRCRMTFVDGLSVSFDHGLRLQRLYLRTDYLMRSLGGYSSQSSQ